MVIAFVSYNDLPWLVELAESHGHTICRYIDFENAITAIRAGRIEAFLVDVVAADERARKRLKRIARQSGIPKEQVMFGYPNEVSAQSAIREWLASLT